MGWRNFAQSFTITLVAIIASMLLFSIFMFVYAGVYPLELFQKIYEGGFGSSFPIQDTLTRAAPLILTALCTALPARVGLIVIGGEGAFVLGGLAAVVTGLQFPASTSPLFVQSLMALAGMTAGGLWIAGCGLLRHWRGVNETISSLLMTYIAIAVFNYLVEGPLKDPDSLNKPSTYAIPDVFTIGTIFNPAWRWIGSDIHWGMVFGIVFCVIAYILMYHTTFGFAARMVGGNVRAAQASGLPVGWLVFFTCLLGGGAAGLAGMVEVCAVHHKANASLIAGYGFTGILVSFIARHHPLAVIPVAVLFGSLSASAGLVQRELHVPEASMQVLQGIMFIMILLGETFYGRFRVFQPPLVKEATPA